MKSKCCGGTADQNVDSQILDKKSQAVHKKKRKQWDLKNSRNLKRCFKHHLLLLYYK